jgi:hypothetical protein
MFHRRPPFLRSFRTANRSLLHSFRPTFSSHLDGEHRFGIYGTFDGLRSGNTFPLVSFEQRL